MIAQQLRVSHLRAKHFSQLLDFSHKNFFDLKEMNSESVIKTALIVAVASIVLVGLLAIGKEIGGGTQSGDFFEEERESVRETPEVKEDEDVKLTLEKIINSRNVEVVQKKEDKGKVYPRVGAKVPLEPLPRVKINKRERKQKSRFLHSLQDSSSSVSHSVVSDSLQPHEL